MLTVILIVLGVVAAVVVLWVLLTLARGLALGGMLAWVGGRSLIRWLQGKPRESGGARVARMREENRRLIAGEGSLRQIRKRMKAERSGHPRGR
jgi:hypothetical protein